MKARKNASRYAEKERSAIQNAEAAMLKKERNGHPEHRSLMQRMRIPIVMKNRKTPVAIPPIRAMQNLEDDEGGGKEKNMKNDEHRERRS